VSDAPCPTLAALAAGMLQIAQQRMLRVYPFHARFVAAWHCQATEATATMGVSVVQGTIVLHYHPAFVVRCTYAELVGVLLHETHHLLFAHLWLDPAQFPDAQALMIAEEVTANEWIHEPLPGTPMLLAHFPYLPANEDTLTRYRRLATAIPEHAPPRHRSQKGGDLSQKSPPDGRNFPPVGQKKARAGPIPATLTPIDDHALWHRARQETTLGPMAVRVEVQAAASGLTPAEWQALPLALQHRLAALCQGDAAGSTTEALAPTDTRSLDWRQLLRRSVREATERRPVFTRPPRRFPAFVGVMPGQVHRPTAPVVMAVIDTSGSMSTSLLECIAGELDGMARSHRVIVVECDAVVHQVSPYRGRLRRVHGRGGTDLRPAFAAQVLSRVHPDVIVYFTDGCGPAPGIPPGVPVIWCLTPDGRKPVHWGRAVWLPVTDAVIE
jgi:predicted metal-dependent peptidase